MKFKIDEPKDTFTIGEDAEGTFVSEGVGYDWDCKENATVSYQYLEPCKTYNDYIQNHLEAHRAKENSEWIFEPKQYVYHSDY